MKLTIGLAVFALFCGPASAQYVQRAQQAGQTMAGSTTTQQQPTRPQGAGTRVMGGSMLAPKAQLGASVNSLGTLRTASGVAGNASVQGISKGIAMFAADVGRLPTAGEGLNGLLQQPAGVKNWRGPYISVNPQRGLNDPWGSPYRYINTTPSGGRPSFMIKSNGPDMQPDTADDLSVSG